MFLPPLAFAGFPQVAVGKFRVGVIPPTRLGLYYGISSTPLWGVNSYHFFSLPPESGDAASAGFFIFQDRGLDAHPLTVLMSMVLSSVHFMYI